MSPSIMCNKCGEIINWAARYKHICPKKAKEMPSLLGAMRNKNTKLVKKIEGQAKRGEIVRLI